MVGSERATRRRCDVIEAPESRPIHAASPVDAASRAGTRAAASGAAADRSSGPDVVVVANRLPVDREIDADGNVSWTRSPGGLVTALEPVMHTFRGTWVGWTGSPDDAPEPFVHDGTLLVPVALSGLEIENFYEGFSNGTLWPLYHDVIATPSYHRHWWEAYEEVNRRFADAAAEVAREGAMVWVHDYQLQLVPAMLRQRRADLRIGYFHHIPFPPYEIFAQLPWRRQIVEGLLGADLLGFQRGQDANNLLRAARRALDLPSRKGRVSVPASRSDSPRDKDTHGKAERTVVAKAYPISIDSRALSELAATEPIRARMTEIRTELDNPRTVVLGVDRLDYTKGITHRLKAFAELLDEGVLAADQTVLVQVATPSRERVEDYRRLRDEIELTVGRINGQHGTLHRPAVVYLHHSYPKPEMAALYQAADVMLVTPLRDGMNLVAKEYVACRNDVDGVLILSEFTGAAEELTQALQVNPHDIDGLKKAIAAAATMPQPSRRRRMRLLRRRVLDYDVARWATTFLTDLEDPVPRLTPASTTLSAGGPTGTAAATPVTRAEIPAGLNAGIRSAAEQVSTYRPLLVALDFDGVLAPIVDDPSTSRMRPGSRAAIERLVQAPGVTVALVSGRRLDELTAVARPPAGVHLVGSHGAEINGGAPELGDEARSLLARLGEAVDAVVTTHPGTRTERKPTTVVLHTRLADPDVAQHATRAVLDTAAMWDGVHSLAGKDVLELSVVQADKGTAVAALAARHGCAATFFIGDDVTDEFVLRRLGPTDLGVKVGPGDTAARYRVAGVNEVSELLTLLADAVAAPAI